MVILFKIISAQMDYIMYYDPLTGSTLHWDSGYDPRKPSHWDKVDKGAWPIILDWGKYLKDASDWYNQGDNGNECKDHLGSSYSSRHKQSPIMLCSDEPCNDRYKMIIVDRGHCTQSQAKFHMTPIWSQHRSYYVQ